MNQKTDASSGVRLAAHWRTISWAVLDKGLQLVYGLGFLLLVAGGLPRDQYGLQSLAMVVQLTASQLFRALLLVPLIKYVAEAGGSSRVASTGLLLHAGACSVTGLLLWGGRTTWAAVFHKPDLAAVLVPTAVLLTVASPRDAAISTLEGQRRLRTVFLLDLTYFTMALVGLGLWRAGLGPRLAESVQWVLAAAAAVAAIVDLLVIRKSLRLPSALEARRILRFGAGSFGSGLGATLQQQGDTLIAGRLMDARGVATYYAAKQIFRVFNVLAQAINQVLMPTVSKLDAERRYDDLRVLFEKTVCFLSLVIVPVCVLLILGAGPLLHMLFAGKYDDSVPVFRLLVASATVLPVATVGSAYLTGLGRLRALVWMTWVGLSLMLGLLVVWIPPWGPVGAAAATLVAAVFGAAARAVVLRRHTGFHFRGIVLRVHDVVAFVRQRLAMLARPG